MVRVENEIRFVKNKELGGQRKSNLIKKNIFNKNID